MRYIKKKGGVVRAGLKKLRSPEFGRLTSGKRTVSRPYGGVLSHEEVKGRYAYHIIHYQLQPFC